MARRSTETVTETTTLLPLVRTCEPDQVEWFIASSVPRVGSALPDAPARVTAAWLSKRHDDPSWARALLPRLPSICHVALALCLDREGSIKATELVNALSECGGQTQLATLAFDRLQALGLGIHRRQPDSSFVAFRRPLAAVANALLGLADAPPPLPDHVKGRGPGRDLAATLALLAHRSLRLTQGGDFHKAKLKSFVKGTGLTVEQAGWRLHIARDFGLICGGIATDLAVDLPVAHAFLGAPGTVVLEAGLRARGPAWFVVPGGDDEDDGLKFVARIVAETTVHEGRLCARIPTLARPDGDGHVTASFEVLLGPEADAALTLVVGMIGELKNADHVLTYKLTPESLARGMSAGVSVALARSELSRVSARPLPDTVRALLDDAERRSARARTIIAIEGLSGALDALAARAGSRVVSRPSRECLLIDASVDFPQLKGLATAAGVALVDGGVRVSEAGSTASFEAMYGSEMRPMAEARRTSARRPLLPRAPDPALRRRFEQAVADRFTEDAKALGVRADVSSSDRRPPRTEGTSGSTSRARPGSPLDEAIDAWNEASAEAREAGRFPEARYFRLVAEAARAIEAELVAWGAMVAGDEGSDDLVDHPSFPMLAFLAPQRRRIALCEGSVDEVMAVARDLDGPGARNAFGRRAQVEVKLLGGHPTRPHDLDHDESEWDDHEVIRVVDRQPTSNELTEMAHLVRHDDGLLLRVTERHRSGLRTLLLVPEGVRSRGRETVLVGEDEDGASRVIKLADIAKVEVVVD